MTQQTIGLASKYVESGKYLLAVYPRDKMYAWDSIPPEYASKLTDKIEKSSIAAMTKITDLSDASEDYKKDLREFAGYANMLVELMNRLRATGVIETDINTIELSVDKYTK